MQIRALRAELNKALQSCKTVAEIRAQGAAFEEKYGQSIWGSTTIYYHETFSSLYNVHLSRCAENEEAQAADNLRAEQIRTEISNCGNLAQFESIKWFIDKRPDLLEDAQVLWELGEKGQEVGHPDYIDCGALP